MKTILVWSDKPLENGDDTLSVSSLLKAYGRNAPVKIKSLCGTRPSQLFDALSGLKFKTVDDGVCVIITGVTEGDFRLAGIVDDDERVGVAAALITRFPNVWPLFVVEEAVEALEKGRKLTDHQAARCASEALEKFLTFDTIERPGLVAKDPRSPLPSAMRDLFIVNHFPNFANPAARTCPPPALQAFIDGVYPLFDPTGLRAWAKARAWDWRLNSGSRNEGRHEPVATAAVATLLDRVCQATVVVDEEPGIALLGAYSAYRDGRRAWLVNTYKVFCDGQWRIDRSWIPSEGLKTNGLVLRDLEIRFIDFPGVNAPDLRRLADWDDVRTEVHEEHRPLTHWKEHATWRVCSSEGKVLTPSEAWSYSNSILDETRRRVADDGRRLGVVSQPGVHATSIDQIEQAVFGSQDGGVAPSPAGNEKDVRRRLYRWFSKWGAASHEFALLGVRKPLNSILFVTEHLQDGAWLGRPHTPPQTLLARLERLHSLVDDVRHHHAAAPVFNQIALSLMESARTLSQESHPRAPVHAAIYSQEAYEILLGRSPATGIEALQYLYRSEAQMETRLAGMSSRLSLSQRRADLSRIIEAVFDADRRDHKKRSDDFSVKIWSEVRSTCREADMISAANAANLEVLANTVWFPAITSLSDALAKTSPGGLVRRSWRAGRNFVSRLRQIAVRAIRDPLDWLSDQGMVHAFGQSKAEQQMTSSHRADQRRRRHRLDGSEWFKRWMLRAMTSPSSWSMVYSWFFAASTLVSAGFILGNRLNEKALIRGDMGDAYSSGLTSHGWLVTSLSEAANAVFHSSVSSEATGALKILPPILQIGFLAFNFLMMAFFVSMIVRMVTRD